MYSFSVYNSYEFNVFQTKTGFPEPLLEQWKNKSDVPQWILEHRIVRSFYLLPKFLSDKEKKEFLKSYKMVTFGRHPFVRLVSTYKDKLIDGNSHGWRKMMNYDKNHPYSVKCLLCITNFLFDIFSLKNNLRRYIREFESHCGNCMLIFA